MTLTELKYIVMVSITKHFGKAAEMCNISQPSLSIAIKKLENELGVLIFERHNTEIITTPIGHQIVAQAKAVLNEAQKIKELATYEKDPLDGPIRLGIIYTISPFLLPELVRKSIARTPQMPLVISEDYTNVLIQKLRSGELDAVICALPIHESHLMCCPLYEEDFVVAVAGNHPFAKKDVIQIDDLNKEEMLLLAQGNCLRDQVLEVCPERFQGEPSENLQNLHFTEGSSLATLRHMVASGLGVSVFPESAVNYDFNDSLVKFVPLAPPAPFRTVSIFWRRTFKREKAILRIVDTCSTINLVGVRHLEPNPHPLDKEGY